MCQNLRYFTCGHMQRCQTKCWKTTNPGILQAIIYFFFPPKSCDRPTGEVFRKRALCPSCVRRQQSRSSDGSKPLPRLPASGKVYREACLAKRAMYENTVPSRITKRLRRGSVDQTPRTEHPRRKTPQHSRRATQRPTPRDDGHRSRKPGGGEFSQSTSAHNMPKSRVGDHQPGHSRKPSTTPSKSGSTASANNATLNQRGREYLRRLRHKPSSEYTTYLDESGNITSWV